MLLAEANAYLNNPITEEELDIIHPLYCILDLEKEDFCAAVDAIGIGKLTAKKSVIERLAKAEHEFAQWERYIQNKRKLEDMEHAAEILKEQIDEGDANENSDN
jgi:hypothetical protein